jgi:hypothetical protein
MALFREKEFPRVVGAPDDHDRIFSPQAAVHRIVAPLTDEEVQFVFDAIIECRRLNNLYRKQFETSDVR